MPQRPSTTKQSTARMPAAATRRARGAPRKLLLDAARALFARQDYRSTTTREIAQAALRTNEARYRTFLDHATDALFLHDDTTRVIDVKGKTVMPGNEDRRRSIHGARARDSRVGASSRPVSLARHPRSSSLPRAARR